MPRTHQRRHGQLATVFKTLETVDRRGNRVVVVDEEDPLTVKAVFIADRSSRAELAGQMEINVYQMLIDADVDVSLWARVEWSGATWDVVNPAAQRFGTKHVRHQTILIRQRPS